MIKNTSIKTLMVLLATVLWIQPLSAREQFGTTTVTKGALTVIRNGETTSVAAGSESSVQKSDLLMAGPDATINWKLDESSAMEIGGNGIVMLKPWIRAGEIGYVSVVFGAVRLQSKSTGVIKTPSAIITGSGDVLIEVTATGSTLASVVTGNAEVNNLSGKPKTIMEGQTALVINGELIMPETDQLAGLNLGGLSLNRPIIGSSESKSFKAEAALLSTGILSEEELKESKSADVSIEESFDIQVDSEAELERLTTKPVSSEMEKDLEVLRQSEIIEVESETNELGTIQIRENTPTDVFAEFTDPKSPAQLFNMDDKTGWSRESGLIQLSVEK